MRERELVLHTQSMTWFDCRLQMLQVFVILCITGLRRLEQAPVGNFTHQSVLISNLCHMYSLSDAHDNIMQPLSDPLGSGVTVQCILKAFILGVKLIKSG